MNDLFGSKLLIISGATVHAKVVEAAKRLGVYTIVTDYLESSPAKLIADKSWMHSILDTDSIVEQSKKEDIDGVLAVCIDPAQRPYQEVCKLLNKPCFCNEEQVFTMTDKHAFKRFCVSCGVDVVPEFTQDDIKNRSIEFPVLVKPVDSRGSRGQTVCNDYKSLEAAVAAAKQESSNGDILIEKYMDGCQEVQVTYCFINGEAYLIRTADSYTGTKENQLEKVVACAVSPSQYTQEYLDYAHENVVKMFKKLGVRNGPVFMQGFKDGNTFRFFDPGIRLPGVDYERVYKNVFGIDLMEIFVRYALTGACGDVILPDNSVWLKGKRVAILFPTVKPGVISNVSGMDAVAKCERIISCWTRYDVGDTVPLCHDVNQRFAEVDILADNTEQLKSAIDWWFKTVSIEDTDGNSMVYERFDSERIC